jgi:hypothetical protein
MVSLNCVFALPLFFAKNALFTRVALETACAIDRLRIILSTGEGLNWEDCASG